MKIATEFERAYPKWLIGDSADDRVFVIHLHWPRFVGEVLEDGSTAARIEPLFIDEPDGMSAPELARLMRQAGEFYQSEMKRFLGTVFFQKPSEHEDNEHEN